MCATSYTSADFLGLSMLSIFISTYEYLTSKLTTVEALALVDITSVRSVTGGTMVVISIPVYENFVVHYSL